MAGSPVVVDYMQTTLSFTVDKNIYARGMEGLFVYGYVTFGLNGYFEPPQFINFEKQQFYPRNNRFDTFMWQCKPGVSLTYKPIYGNLDALNPVIQGQIVNMLAGAVTGLTPIGPGGPGVAPIIVPAP